MRIAQITRYSLRLTRPLLTASGAIARRRGLLVRVEENGREGVGEAAPLPGFSEETLDEAEAALRAGGRDLPPSAAHALDQAQLDLAARAAGVSVARLLRPGCPRSAPVGRLVADTEQARAAVRDGARLVKLKVGAAALAFDLRRVAAVRAAVGEGVLIRLDANGAWSPEIAQQALEQLKPLGIECVEDPVEDLAAMAVLRSIGIPLAADAPARDADGVRAVLEAGAADRVVIKPMFVGGLTAALALIDQAAAGGVDAFVTTAVDAAVGRWGALQVAAAAGCQIPCGLDTGGWLARDVAAGPRMDPDGLMRVVGVGGGYTLTLEPT